MIKCICGYKQGYDIELQKNIGDDEFILSELQLTYEYDYTDRKKAILVCPRCGTLKINL